MSLNPSVVTEIMEAPVVRPQAWAQKAAVWVLHLFWVLLLLICIQAPIVSILVFGWMYTLMRALGLRMWQRRVTIAEMDPALSMQHQPFANPLLLTPQQVLLRRDRSLMNSLLFSVSCVVRNITGLWVFGLQIFLNTAIFLVPIGMLWSFSWWGGWNNSFFKGYESYAVGPSLGFTGVMLFCVVMLYVPLAQARHAITGQWRAFWDVRMIRQIIGARPFACLFLALAFAIAQVPVMLLKSIPFQFTETVAHYDVMTDAQVHDLSQAYFFYCGIYILLAALLLKYWAMRIYTKGILKLIHKDVVRAEQLSGCEAQALDSFGISDVGKCAEGAWKRVVKWPLQTLCLIACLLLWFSFVGQLYFAQFLKYDSNGYGKGWVNQPLIHLPWFNYTPSHLLRSKENLSDVFLGR